MMTFDFDESLFEVKPDVQALETLSSLAGGIFVQLKLRSIVAFWSSREYCLVVTLLNNDMLNKTIC